MKVVVVFTAVCMCVCLFFRTISLFYCKISSFRQSGNKLNMFNLFRLCRKDEISFDIVAETGNIVAKNGNYVEATFDIVKRIVQLVAFDNVAWTLLLVRTGFKWSIFYCNELLFVSAFSASGRVCVRLRQNQQ